MNKKNNPSQKRLSKILQLEQMNWKQIDALPRESTIFFLPLSPLEVHGPHLPVGTDLLTSRDAAKAAIEQIQHQRSDLTNILFPAIPLGFTKMAACFPGTVSTQVRTIKQVINDIISSLAEYGFKYFIICSFHMDLGHLKAIYAAIKKLNRQYYIFISEPWGPYFYSGLINKQEPKVGFDTKKEIHAGFRETSLMKYQYPYLVDTKYHHLQNIYRNLLSPKCLGKNFKDLGIYEGYVGSPAQADSNYGRWYFQKTVNIFFEAALNLVDGKPLPTLPKQTKLLMKSLFWI